MRRATPASPKSRGAGSCFNSRPSCDGRPRTTSPAPSATGFNSRPSCDGRHTKPKPSPTPSSFQFTPVMRRATGGLPAQDERTRVSIHARHATGDVALGSLQISTQFQFTPVMRRATLHPRRRRHHREFQFTPVMRRATATWSHKIKGIRFNSRPSCDGRLNRCLKIYNYLRFNSRPSCDGRHIQIGTNPYFASFQFTPVMRRATLPRRDGDERREFQFTPVMRRATIMLIHKIRDIQFQFTPVMRRATPGLFDTLAYLAFQFTPVMRRATTPSILCSPSRSFNSRPSCDGRPPAPPPPPILRTFQFTPVMRRATRCHLRKFLYW